MKDGFTLHTKIFQGYNSWRKDLDNPSTACLDPSKEIVWIKTIEGTDGMKETHLHRHNHEEIQYDQQYY